MKGLHINGRFRFGLRGFPEYPGRALKQLIAPLLDLVWMNIELLRQLDQRSGADAAPLGPRSPSLSPMIAATATFALNAGLWFRRGRLAMVFSSLAASCRCCAEIPLIPAVQIPAAASAPIWR
jgi:hypothetical protein